MGAFRRLTTTRPLFLTTILLLMALSISSTVQPASAYVSGLTVTPNNVTARSGTEMQTIGFAVSATISGCWGICEATWFGATGFAPFVDDFATTTGCSLANYNTFWWSGTCTITIFLYVNHGGVTPPGTYYPIFYVYTYSPKHLETTITLTVT
jgi:hypothetical protein